MTGLLPVLYRRVIFRGDSVAPQAGVNTPADGLRYLRLCHQQPETNVLQPLPYTWSVL